MRMRDENEERYIMSSVFSKIDEEKGERGEGYNAFRREKKGVRSKRKAGGENFGRMIGMGDGSEEKCIMSKSCRVYFQRLTKRKKRERRNIMRFEEKEGVRTKRKAGEGNF